MERELGQDIKNPIQREAFLKDNCDACEQKGYMKPYTPEELQWHKEKLANVSIEIAEIEAEKKQVEADFKGMPAETIEVETFAQVNGREVAFVLLSPGAQATLEDLRDKVIDDEIARIKDIAPEIAIIEI